LRGKLSFEKSLFYQGDGKMTVRRSDIAIAIKT